MGAIAQKVNCMGSVELSVLTSEENDNERKASDEEAEITISLLYYRTELSLMEQGSKSWHPNMIQLTR
jgi:hypothetical protein